MVQPRFPLTPPVPQLPFPFQLSQPLIGIGSFQPPQGVAARLQAPSPAQVAQEAVSLYNALYQLAQPLPRPPSENDIRRLALQIARTRAANPAAGMPLQLSPQEEAEILDWASFAWQQATALAGLTTQAYNLFDVLIGAKVDEIAARRMPQQLSQLLQGLGQQAPAQSEAPAQAGAGATYQPPAPTSGPTLPPAPTAGLSPPEPPQSLRQAAERSRRPDSDERTMWNIWTAYIRKGDYEPLTELVALAARSPDPAIRRWAAELRRWAQETFGR